jgi:L-tyrosine isonitrile synthase
VDSVALVRSGVISTHLGGGQASGPADHSRFLQKVIQSFNTWAFKREQPCRPEMLARVVAHAIQKNKPIEFVLYWGKGPRCVVAGPELQCLDYLASLGKRVQAAYPPGVAIHLVLTDTHAQLNGHSAESIAAYYREVECEAGHRGFACHRLGSLTAQANIDIGGVEAPPETLSLLEQSAARWYRGEGTARDGAVKYYRMNMLEKRVIAKAFPNSVFVTFNGSEQRELFPDSLPIFYMYSTKRGTAVKPWFQAAGDLEPVLATAAG